MGVRILAGPVATTVTPRQRLLLVHRTRGRAVSRLRGAGFSKQQCEALAYLLNLNGYDGLIQALASMQPGGWTIVDGRQPEALLQDLPPPLTEPAPLYTDDAPSSPEQWLQRPPTWLLSALVVLLVGLGGLAIILAGVRHPFELFVPIVVLVAGSIALFRFARMAEQRKAATLTPGSLLFDPEIHTADSIPAIESIMLMRQTDGGWEASFWHCAQPEPLQRGRFELDRTEAQQLFATWAQPEWRSFEDMSEPDDAS